MASTLNVQKQLQISFLSVLESDASRLKCHYCADGDCLHDDKAGANFGKEIICPKGVTKCVVTGNKWNDRFYRSCEWQLKDSTMDQLGDDKGWCTTTKDETRMCACSTDNCNTGFHGECSYNSSLFSKAVTSNQIPRVSK